MTRQRLRDERHPLQFLRFVSHSLGRAVQTQKHPKKAEKSAHRCKSARDLTADLHAKVLIPICPRKMDKVKLLSSSISIGPI
jgi:hypothetical protein